MFLFRSPVVSLFGLFALAACQGTEAPAPSTSTTGADLVLPSASQPVTSWLFWQNQGTGVDAGKLALWRMNGTTLVDSFYLDNVAPVPWKLEATGDLDGDGQRDLLWRYYGADGTTQTHVWLMNGPNIRESKPLSSSPDASWNILGTFDANNDGKDDIIWSNQKPNQWSSTNERWTNLSIGVWEMNGAERTTSYPLPLPANTAVTSIPTYSYYPTSPFGAPIKAGSFGDDSLNIFFQELLDPVVPEHYEVLRFARAQGALQYVGANSIRVGSNGIGVAETLPVFGDVDANGQGDILSVPRSLPAPNPQSPFHLTMNPSLAINAPAAQTTTLQPSVYESTGWVPVAIMRPNP